MKEYGDATEHCITQGSESLSRSTIEEWRYEALRKMLEFDILNTTNFRPSEMTRIQDNSNESTFLTVN